MTGLRTILLALFLATPLAQASDSLPDSVLIKKLGSANFEERQAAAAALKKRPDSVPALRDALRSPDTELARRAAEILDYFDQQALIQMDTAIKDGHIEKVIDRVANWPRGKNEEELWQSSRKIWDIVFDLHQKKGGKKIEYNPWAGPKVLIDEKRVSEKTKLPDAGCYFFRGTELDIAVDYSKIIPGKRATTFERQSVFAVVNGPVRLKFLGPAGQAVFATESVELIGDFTNTLVISGGDVILSCEAFNCVIIARGNIKVDRSSSVTKSRLISRKAIATGKFRMHECVISENDLNPLGFIRWADAPKDKAPVKAK